MQGLRTLLLVAALAGAVLSPAAQAQWRSSRSMPAVQNISPQTAREQMTQDPSILILDVRTPQEFATGRIPGAVNVPLDQLQEGRIPETLLAQKQKRILLYCRSGRRSQAAAEILLSHGFREPVNFGGILDWPFEIVR